MTQTRYDLDREQALALCVGAYSYHWPTCVGMAGALRAFRELHEEALAMNENEYAPAREPTRREWEVWAHFLDARRSVSTTAFEFGIERAEVLRAVERVRWYRQDAGYDRRYRKAKQAGMPEDDCRLHAEQEAAFNIRTLNKEGA